MMTMRAAAAAAGFVLLGGCGDSLETRTFPIEHVAPASITPLIQPYINSEGSLVMEGTPAYPSIAVRERPEVLRTIAEIIEQHDQPQPTVTLRFQIIEANGFTTTDPAIADVEAVLRDLFRFQGYRLLAEGVMSNLTPMLAIPAERKSWADYQNQQKVRSGEREFGILTDVRAIKRVVDGVSTADLAVLLYENRPPFGSETLLETSVRVPDGQTVVIGNSVAGADDNTVILVVRPEMSR